MDSPEYKTLAQFYPALVSCVGQAPVNIAVQLIPYGILAPRDVQYLSNPSIVDNEKARRLLGIVVNQMKTDPQVYHTFIAALKDAGDWTRTLVSLLEQAYARWMQSSNADVHSTEELGAFPHTFSGTHTKEDHHSQSSHLVELGKRFQFSNEDINKEVSDEHILKIYPQLEKWERVAAYFGFRLADTQAIESQARSNEKLMRLYMLGRWKRMKIGKTTYQVLLKALMKCNCSESAVQLCELLNEEKKDDEDSTHLYNEAMKAGYVTIKTTTVLLFGMAGTGKTTTKHLILDLPLPTKRDSTPLADTRERVLIRDVAGMKIQIGGDSWKPVTVDNLKKHTADLIRAHRIHKKPLKERDTKFNKLSPMENIQSETIDIEAGISETNSELLQPISEVASEIQSLVPSDSDRSRPREVLGSNWIYLIDSGGQPHFHNLLPLFVQGISLAIYVFRLSNKLSDSPLVEYYKNDQPVGKTYRPFLTTETNFKYLVQSMQSQAHSKESRLVCVGTYKDIYDREECIETLEEKNSCLRNMLPESIKKRTAFYNLYKEEIIFPMDAKHNSSERNKIIETIRNKIMEQQPSEIKVPLWWYVFEISIEKISREQKKKIFSIEECTVVASEFDVSDIALNEALTFFHKHHIFHYYPKVLPRVVFCDTQVLLDMITELVEYATGVKESIMEGTEGVWLKFIDRGIINEEFLVTLERYYVDGLFSACDLLKVFERLLIASKYSDDAGANMQTEYYMPTLLKSLLVPQIDEKRTELLKKSQPLVIRFENDWPYCGVFCCLQVYLIKECKWKFSKENPKQNFVRMRLPNQPCSVTLVDLIKHIEVYVSCPVTIPYALISDSIHSGIYSACKTLRYYDVKLEDAFLCPHCDEIEGSTSQTSNSSICHLALVLGTSCFLSCTQTDDVYPLNEQHKNWLIMTDVGYVTKSRLGTTRAFSEHQLDLKGELTQGEIKLNRLKQRMNVTDEHLDRECEDEDLDHLGRNLAGYMEYANGLGLTQAEIGNLNGNVNIAHSTQLKLAAAFKLWKSKCKADSFPATYQSLLKVALKLKDGNGAEMICKTCLERSCATPSTEMEEMNTVTSASAEHSQGRSTQEVQHVPTTQDSAQGVITLEELIRHTGVTQKQLEQECDDVLLNDIAEHIVSYSKYGPKLGLSAADITTFQQNMRIADNAKLITAEVFKEWHKKRSFLATYRVLAEVALELGDGTGAKTICELCAKEKISQQAISTETYQRKGSELVVAMEKQPVLSQDVPTETSQQATPTEETEPADSLSSTLSEEDVGGRKRDNTDAGSYPDEKRPRLAIETRASKTWRNCKDMLISELSKVEKSEALEKIVCEEGYLSSSDHRKFQSHIGEKSQLLVDILTSKIEVQPHSFFEIIHVLESQKVLSPTLIKQFRKEYEELFGIEILYWKSLKVTNESQVFELREYGLTVSIPDCSLPPHIKSCILTIGVSVSGEFVFPDKHNVISAIYCFQTIKGLKFVKPIQITMEHCANLEAWTESDLKIVRASCSDMTPPYVFKELPTSSKKYPSVKYISAEVNQFSMFTVCFPGSKFYTASLLINKTNPSILIPIMPKLLTNMSHIEEYYGERGYRKITALDCIEFKSDSKEIKLRFKKNTEDGWILQQHKILQISQEQVDMFRRDQEKPSFHLKLEQKPNNFTKLSRKFTLEGINADKHSGNQLIIIDEEVKSTQQGTDTEANEHQRDLKRPLQQFCTMPEDEVEEEHDFNVPNAAPGRARKHLLWDMTQIRELKIHFLNPDILRKEEWKCGGDDQLTTSQILDWVDSGWNKEGQQYPKLLNMKATKEEAHIRVLFQRSGTSWSKVGTAATGVKDKGAPTMVLNLYRMTKADQRSMVLHEFGHVLGLDHEHQRSRFWDILGKKDPESGEFSFIIGEDRMKSGDSGNCSQATKEIFKANLTAPADAFETEYDPDSIMHYWFDIKWLQPEWRRLAFVKRTTDLTEPERRVIMGVHARDYHKGQLPKNPSSLDFETLTKAYSPKEE